MNDKVAAGDEIIEILHRAFAGDESLRLIEVRGSFAVERGETHRFIRLQAAQATAFHGFEQPVKLLPLRAALFDELRLIHAASPLCNSRYMLISINHHKDTKGAK